MHATFKWSLNQMHRRFFKTKPVITRDKDFMNSTHDFSAQYPTERTVRYKTIPQYIVTAALGTF
jgi:hypothetical protein